MNQSDQPNEVRSSDQLGLDPKRCQECALQPCGRCPDTQVQRSHHEWDDDGCCIHCGFDGAEWHWWKHSTYEGRAQPEARMPLCKERKI